MLFGRPTNLWLGAFSGLLGAAVVILANLVPPIVIPGAVVGAVTAAVGALIAVVANQPPTLNPGDTFHTVTEAGQPNFVTTVATPPAADAPPVPDGQAPPNPPAPGG
jgi:hypothetical protein